MRELPNKLSDLLRLAVEDAKKAEASDKYALAMGVWHVPATVSQYYMDKFGKDKCIVCMAGAVMAFSLEAPLNIPLWPDYYSGESPDDEEFLLEEEDRASTTRSLLAIDSLRTGDLTAAYCESNGVSATEVPDAIDGLERVWVKKYREAEATEQLRFNGAMPWDWYEKMADQLEEAGY